MSRRFEEQASYVDAIIFRPGAIRVCLTRAEPSHGMSRLKAARQVFSGPTGTDHASANYSNAAYWFVVRDDQFSFVLISA